MYSHVCRVNALSPCHAGVGGLTLPGQNKVDPFLTLGLQQEAIYKARHPVSLTLFKKIHQFLVFSIFGRSVAMSGCGCDPLILGALV